MGVEGATTVITRLLLDQSGRENRAPRALCNDPGPVALGAIISEKELLKGNFFSFVPFKPLQFCSYRSDPEEKNMGVESTMSPFQ
ncbi:hypothetical protein V1477_006657 [Vespula maculifrons]|uniref:Uncharacterized protein n=1 Tax=Vespula maculifrons TaxID=7453 RepID=A0ABD2CKH1_VESMC